MKKVWIYQILYYILVPVVYFLTVWLLTEMYERFPYNNDLGVALVFDIGTLFLVTPVVVGCMMRLSLLRWIVDPFAAVEIPVLLYLDMLRGWLLFWRSPAALHNSLSWWSYAYLAAIFLFGLVCSVSRKRMEGNNLVYRLLNR